MGMAWNGDGSFVASKKPAKYVIPAEGARVLGRLLLHPRRGEESRRSARVDRLRLRPEEQRGRDRLHLLRLAGQAEPAARACSPRASTPIRRSSRPADARQPRAQQGDGEGHADPRADLDGVQVGLVGRRAEGKAGRRRNVGAPRYPGWLSLPAVSWYALFFLGPLGIMAVYSFAEVAGFTGVAFTWNLENYRYLWDPLYAEIFKRTLWLSLIGTRSACSSHSRSRTTSPATRSGRRSC